MELTILGARANIRPQAEGYRLHAGLLVDGRLLFDVGERAFMRHDPKAVFITHLHPDHAYFMLGKEEPAPKTDMYGPEARLGLRTLSRSMDLDGYRVTPVPTLHSVNAKSQGYLIEKGGRKIFYTGDIAWIEKAWLAGLPKLDAVVAEASYMRRGGLVRKHAATGLIFGHTGVPDIIRMFQDKTPLIIFMHLGSWFVNDPEAGRRKFKELERPDLKLVAARDGMTIKI